MALIIWPLMIVMQFLVPLWWLVAGSFGVILYRRLTGMSLTVLAGARLGSITGVLWWLSIAGITAIGMGLAQKAEFQAIMTQNPDLLKVLSDPQSVALYVLGILPFAVGICAAGGALGARFANRNAKV